MGVDIGYLIRRFCFVFKIYNTIVSKKTRKIMKCTNILQKMVAPWTLLIDKQS